MGLAERLEKLAKQLDKQRWEKLSVGSCIPKSFVHEYPTYNIEAVETAELLLEAAKQLRGYHLLVDQARSSLAKH